MTSTKKNIDREDKFCGNEDLSVCELIRPNTRALVLIYYFYIGLEGFINFNTPMYCNSRRLESPDGEVFGVGGK